MMNIFVVAILGYIMTTAKAGLRDLIIVLS